ncbi:MAG: phosphatase PAP2 family protein [Fimbriimonadaceae bacterium]|nr:phosphatase PAP2 family protein [Fimbriimonadaceae bacterium]
MRALDLQVFHAINGWPEWLSPIMVFLSEATKQTPVRLLLVALVIFLLARKNTRAMGFAAILAFPMANEICDVLKAVFQMARPSVEVTDAIIRTAKLTSFGTASAHSANMAAVAFVFTVYAPRWGAIWIVLAFLTGLSRIYVGVHYPSQVLFGWAVGIFSGFLVVKTFEAYARIRRKATDEPSANPAEQE